MTYTKTFDEAKFTEIEDLLKQLTNLESGGEVSISHLNAHEMAHVRWLIYDWLHHMGVKGKFRVRTDPERGALVVRRLGLTSTPHVEVNRSGLPSGLARILEDLVALDDQRQAEQKLELLVSEKKISHGEFGELLLELRRVFT